MARQPAGRLPKRLMDGKLVGGEDSGKGRPEQNGMDYLKDDFQACLCFLLTRVAVDLIYGIT